VTLTPRTVLITHPAEADLMRIYLHLEALDPDAAQRTIADLNLKIFDVARLGLTGSSRPFVPADVRAFPYKRYCFYFTINDDSLILLRVLHHAQDVDTIIFKDDS